MECQFNMGKTERRIRIVLGILLLGLAGLTMLPEWGSLLAFAVGVLALFTGIRQFCPFRKWLGFNTGAHHPVENH